MSWWKKACSSCDERPNGKWDPFLDGTYVDTGKVYPLKWILKHAEDFPVLDLNIEEIIRKNSPLETKEGNFVKQINNPSKQFKERSEQADLKFPILVSSDGWIIDGSHRVAKAYWLGNKTIKGRIIDISALPDPSYSAGDQ